MNWLHKSFANEIPVEGAESPIGSWANDVATIFAQNPHPRVGGFKFSPLDTPEPIGGDRSFISEFGIGVQIDVNTNYAQYGGDTIANIRVFTEHGLLGSDKITHTMERGLPRPAGGLPRWRMELAQKIVNKVYEIIDDEIGFSESMGIDSYLGGPK